MYKASITAKKGTVGGLLVTIAMAGATKLSEYLGSKGVSVSPEIILGSATSAYLALSNWIKNRKR